MSVFLSPSLIKKMRGEGGSHQEENESLYVRKTKRMSNVCKIHKIEYFEASCPDCLLCKHEWRFDILNPRWFKCENCSATIYSKKHPRLMQTLGYPVPCSRCNELVYGRTIKSEHRPVICHGCKAKRMSEAFKRARLKNKTDREVIHS